MIQLPSGLFYQGADLGFNALVIGAGGTGTGLVVPWATRHRIRAACVYFEIVAGPSASFTLQSFVFNETGQSQIVQGQNLVTVMTADQMTWINDSTGRATNGTLTASALPTVMGAPYLRFDVVNNDGVNAGTVTLRALLMH